MNGEPSNKNVNQENPVKLKIAAYNVEYSKNATATEIGEALKPYNFDVVCFSEAPGGNWTQEVGENQKSIIPKSAFMLCISLSDGATRHTSTKQLIKSHFY